MAIPSGCPHSGEKSIKLDNAYLLGVPIVDVEIICRITCCDTPLT